MWEVKNIFPRNFKIICTTNVERITMKKRLKTIKDVIEKAKKENYFNYDVENRMIINMEIKNDDNFLDEFSKSNYPIINTQIADYIEKVTTAIKPTQQFTLRIHGDCIDENEKIIYTKAIRNYYIDKYVVDNRKLNNNRKISLFLGAIGILVLIFVIVLEYMENSILWMRVFDIVAWVLIWETVDIILFKCKELRMSQIKYLNLIDMNIEYI